MASTPLFRGVDVSVVLDDLSPRLRSYRRGDTVVTSGDPFFGLGIVMDGVVIVQKDGMAGERSVFAGMEKGDMFGEMACFLDVKTWPATVAAQENCTILFLSPENLIHHAASMTESHRKLLQNMLRFMAKRALKLNQRLDVLSNRTIRGKLVAYLLWARQEQGGGNTVNLSMTRHQFADYLNVTRPSLSRELAAMRDEGLIEYYRSTIRLLDVDRLLSDA